MCVDKETPGPSTEGRRTSAPRGWKGRRTSYGSDRVPRGGDDGSETTPGPDTPGGTRRGDPGDATRPPFPPTRSEFPLVDKTDSTSRPVTSSSPTSTHHSQKDPRREWDGCIRTGCGRRDGSWVRPSRGCPAGRQVVGSVTAGPRCPRYEPSFPPFLRWIRGRWRHDSDAVTRQSSWTPGRPVHHPPSVQVYPPSDHRGP